MPATQREGHGPQHFIGHRPGRLYRPRRPLRAGLVQLLCALAGLVLGVLLPRISTETSVASSRVTEALVGVGFGILGLVSIIFSLLFLVVQWAFGSLSPRLNLFRDDPIVWRTFGLAVGVFVFSVTSALAIGNKPEVSVIVPATEVAAMLAALAMLRTLQVRAFASIQLAPTLAAIATRGRGIIDDLYPRADPAGLPPRRCRRFAAPSPGPTGRSSCSSSTCGGWSVRPTTPSSCSGPASATRSRRALGSRTCTVAKCRTR